MHPPLNTENLPIDLGPAKSDETAMASADSPACVEAPHPYSNPTTNDSAEHVQRTGELAERLESSLPPPDDDSSLYLADDESSLYHTDDSDEGYYTDKKSKDKDKDKGKAKAKGKGKTKRKRKSKSKRKGKAKGKEPPSHTKAVAWKLNTSGHEVLLGLNERVPATSEEVGLGGDKRAFVKITVEFDGGHTADGSGVLISESKVATAGHILLDDEGRGPAKSVVILAGVHGEEGKVERRRGIYAVVPYGWFADFSDANDVGLIHLNKAFNTVRPVKVKQTPDTASVTVYGYPGDKLYDCQYLVYSEAHIWYDHVLTEGIVEHTGETVEACSGGALVDVDGLLVAIHTGFCKKGNGEKINEAAAINREGNDFAQLVAVLEHIHGDGHGVSEVPLFAKEGDNIEVENIGQVERVDGFAYAW